MPLAPGRFSTMTCWPRRSDIFGAMRRDMMSVVLPGGNGMMMRIGLDGYCAWAAQQTANNRTPSRRFMAILLAMILRALAAAAVLVSTAAAQDYPSKPIR